MMMLCSLSLCLGCLDVLLPRYLGVMEQGGFVILNNCQERFLQLSGKISTITRRDFSIFRREMLCDLYFPWFQKRLCDFIQCLVRSGCMIFYNFHGKFLQFSEEVLWFSIIFRRGCMNLYNFSGAARGRFALFYIIFQERLCDFISFFRRGCVILYHF